MFSLGGARTRFGWPFNVGYGQRMGSVDAKPGTVQKCAWVDGSSIMLRCEALGEVGLVTSGLSPDGRLVEIGELDDHPWMLGTQFHPELKSRPNRPHPLFRDFVGAVRAHRNGTSSNGTVLHSEPAAKPG